MQSKDPRLALEPFFKRGETAFQDLAPASVKAALDLLLSAGDATAILGPVKIPAVKSLASFRLKVNKLPVETFAFADKVFDEILCHKLQMKFVVTHAEKLPTPEEVAALTGFSEVAKFFSSVGGDGAALEVARTAAKLCTPEPPKKEPGETQKEKPGEKVVENPSKDEVADNQSVPPFAKGDKCILSAVKQKEKYNGAECTIEVVQKAKCKIWIPKLSEFKLVPFDKLTLVSSAVNPTTVQSSDVAKPSDAAKLNAILGNDD